MSDTDGTCPFERSIFLTFMVMRSRDIALRQDQDEE